MTNNGLTTETMNHFMELCTMANDTQLIAMKRHIETQLLIRDGVKQ